MRSSNRLYLLVLTLVVAGFVYGAATLFMDRYSRGDVYPPYSSFRADPLGTKALFEALQSVPGLHVARNIDPINKIASNRAITLFINGFDLENFGTQELDAGLADALQRIMRGGGRVVMSFAPVVEDITYREQLDEEFQKRMSNRRSRGGNKDEKREDGGSKDESGSSEDAKAEAEPEEETSYADKKSRDESVIKLSPESDESAPAKDDNAKHKEDEADKDDEERDRLSPFESFMHEPVRWEKQWDVELRFGSLDHDSATNTVKPVTAHRAIDAALPEQLPVHTTLYFEPKSDAWHTIYSSLGHAVLVERPVGDGMLVLVADSHVLSNEAMRTDRHPDILAWLAGPNSAIVFDEVTLGTQRTRGIAALMWQYRLQGVVMALILMATLFIWKNGQPLVPPFYDALPTDAYAYVGKDSAAGFSNLLKRSVPSAQILRTCLTEWEKSFSHRAADLAESVRDAKAIVLREDSVPASKRNLVQAYRDICTAFAKHRLG